VSRIRLEKAGGVDLDVPAVWVRTAGCVPKGLAIKLQGGLLPDQQSQPAGAARKNVPTQSQLRTLHNSFPQKRMQLTPARGGSGLNERRKHLKDSRRSSCSSLAAWALLPTRASPSP
jgi:hypothetical protein